MHTYECTIIGNFFLGVIVHTQVSVQRVITHARARAHTRAHTQRRQPHMHIRVWLIRGSCHHNVLIRFVYPSNVVFCFCFPGILYDKTCMEGCLRLNRNCEQKCTGAEHLDCIDTCRTSAIHCTMICIDYDKSEENTPYKKPIKKAMTALV